MAARMQRREQEALTREEDQDLELMENLPPGFVPGLPWGLSAPRNGRTKKQVKEDGVRSKLKNFIKGTDEDRPPDVIYLHVPKEKKEKKKKDKDKDLYTYEPAPRKRDKVRKKPGDKENL